MHVGLGQCLHAAQSGTIPDCCILALPRLLVGLYYAVCHAVHEPPRLAIQAQALFAAGLDGCDAGGTNWSAVWMVASCGLVVPAGTSKNVGMG